MANAADTRDFPSIDDRSIAANVLVVTPPETTETACAELLAARGAAASSVLCLTVAGAISVPFDRRIAPDTGVADDPSAETSCEGDDSPAVISGMSDPVELGVGLTEFLAGRPREDRLVICLHSLTALLRSTTLDHVYRFLVIATGQVRTADAVAHYHVDPTAHDDRTMATIERLFDTIVEIDQTGDWRITNTAGQDP